MPPTFLLYVAFIASAAMSPVVLFAALSLAVRGERQVSYTVVQRALVRRRSLIARRDRSSKESMRSLKTTAQAVNFVLFEHWDPIGVRGANGPPDEYSTYGRNCWRSSHETRRIRNSRNSWVRLRVVPCGWPCLRCQTGLESQLKSEAPCSRLQRRNAISDQPSAL